METPTSSQTRDTIMASQQEADKSKARGGGYLFTPPEHTYDSFSQQEDERYVDEWRKVVQQQPVLPPIVRTPPESPHNAVLPSIGAPHEFGTQDTPLFPQRAPSERAQSPQPLFSRHLSQSPSPAQRAASTPAITAPEPSTAAVSAPRARSIVEIYGISSAAQAGQFFRDNMDEVRRMGSLALPKPYKSPLSRLSDEDLRQLHSLNRSAGISKPRSAASRLTSRPTKPKAALPATSSSTAKTSPPKRRTPKARTYSDFYDTAFPPRDATSTTKHKRAPPSKKVDGENVNWTELPDYAPPASDLDTNPKALKVTWHGHQLSLADDPQRNELHEQELQVAQTLRLNGATYLTNKRKIFQGRLQALKDEKNFTKTAAQSACKIDVNKASQLWEAFDRVGWFDPKWYAKYL